MITADILMWFLLIVGLLIVFNSYWLMAVALFPHMVERARGNYSRPIKCIVVGLLAAVPILFLGVAVASSKNPAAKLLGLSISAAPVLLGLLGSAGLSQRIGLGMASPAADAQPWRRVLRGGTVLSLAFLLPFLGWFGVMPLTLLSGFGAFLLSLRKGSNSPAVVEVRPDIPLPAAKEMA